MSDALASKIAAGEVIERPASIVKELVENSLDAGATEISIELENGGKKSIRIVDNGEGMDHDNAILAFERHATSKIYSFDELYEIKSLGFRGEALPSIASVCRLEMLTRTEKSPAGTRLIVEGGTRPEVMDAGCPVGTTIIAKDIFFSTPARKKFLKKDSTEQAHCVDAVTRLALGHPEVKITVRAPKRTLLNLPKTTDLAERIALLFGDGFGNHILPVKDERGHVTLHGFISEPSYTRSNSKNIFCFVNGRYIRDNFMLNAIMTPYRRIIEHKRFPAVVLFIDVPPADIDVNVHPTKMEVRFKNQWEIYKLIGGGIGKALADAAPLSQMASFYSTGPADTNPTENFTERVQESLRRYTVYSGAERPTFRLNDSDDFMQQNLQRLFDTRVTTPTVMLFSTLEYMGQFDGTYLVFSGHESLVLIDQHAAHERILFEKLKKISYENAEEKQLLLIPEVIQLSPAEFALFGEYRHILEDAGFDVEEFGTHTVAVKSIPAILAGINLQDLIADISGEISKTGKAASIDEAKDTIFSLMACKGAIKANQKLDRPEVNNLLRELDMIPIASTCPHGRPIFIKFSIHELERMFKRR